MHCPECSRENPASARFCGKCGASLSRLCPHCGAGLPPDPDLRFCLQCGQELGPPAAPDEPPVVATDTIPERIRLLLPQEAAAMMLPTPLRLAPIR
jgi:adenylate cyclase